MEKDLSNRLTDQVIHRLKELRKEQGLSHEKLAKLSGLHRSSISLIESRKRQPTLYNCFRIAHALGYSLSDVISSLEENDKGQY